MTQLLLQETRPAAGGGSAQLWIGLLLMIGVFYFMLFRGNQKGKKQRQDLLTNLQKNDRVVTIGGVIGTVVQVRDAEVVLKVDESTNTKMTFRKEAIHAVLKEEGDSQKTAGEAPRT